MEARSACFIRFNNQLAWAIQQHAFDWSIARSSLVRGFRGGRKRELVSCNLSNVCFGYFQLSAWLEWPYLSRFLDGDLPGLLLVAMANHSEDSDGLQKLKRRRNRCGQCI